MAKRTREPSVEFEMKDGFVVIKYSGKEYAWFPPTHITLDNLLNDPRYEPRVIHNFENRAMFNIEDLRNNEDVLRQEINPLSKKDIDEWVVDE